MSTTIDKILSLVRELNNDPFREQLTHGNSLEDALKELEFHLKSHLSVKEQINIIIQHMLNFNVGDFTTLLPISDEQNELDVISMSLNIFAEELKENAFSIKTFDELFNTLHNPFFIVNIDEGFLMKYNESCLRFFNYNEENRYKISADIILPNSFIGLIKEFFHGHNTHETTTISLKEKNSKEQYLIIHLNKLSSSFNDTNLVSVFITDITAQVENEKYIKAKELAEHSSKMKEEFLANMSHEIRTPMNTIVGLSNLLIKSQNLDPKQTEYIKSISINSKNLLGVINDILDYSKIEAGKIEFENQTFNLQETIQYIKDALSMTIHEKGVLFTINIDPKVPHFIKGDSVKLTQVLINLVGNAAKFTHEGEILLSVSLFDKTPDKINLRFSIKDTGIGISKEKQNSIFESFTQASSDTTRKYGGTGLGLTIVKKIIELQKGNIHLHSELGKGTEFIFELSFGLPNEKTNRELKRKIDPKQISNLTILLVEDNTFNQMVTIDTLKDANPLITIDIAENGKIALEKLKEKTYDLILMDIQMPEMDGHTATKILRKKLNISTPIIAMTAHASYNEIEACYNNGMNDYVTKPFDADNFFDKIIHLTSPEKEIPDNKDIKNSIDSLNTSNIFYFTKGDQKRINKMVNIFLSDTPGEIIQLRKHYENNEMNLLRILAHSMKPKFAMMGMEEFHLLVSDIELLALEGKKEEIPQHIHTLENKIPDSYQKLMGLIKE